MQSETQLLNKLFLDASRPTDSEANRQSWEEAEQDRENFSEAANDITNTELERASENLAEALLQLDTVTDAALPRLSSLCRILCDQVVDRANKGDYDNNDLIAKYHILDKMYYSLSISGCLFGPNNLGYIPGESMGSVNLEVLLVERMDETYEILSELPELLGPNTKKIYTAVINKLRTNRTHLRSKTGVRDFKDLN